MTCPNCGGALFPVAFDYGRIGSSGRRDAGVTLHCKWCSSRFDHDQEPARNAAYKITGSLPDGCEGYSIWDYLPERTHLLTFTSREDAILWAQQHSKGPDCDGIEPKWDAVAPVAEAAA